MAKERDRDEDLENEPEDEERRDEDDEELDDEEVAEDEDDVVGDDESEDEDDADLDDEPEDEEEDDEEPPPPRKRSSRRGKASSRKKRAEQKRVSDEEEEEEDRPRRRRAARRTSRRDDEERKSTRRRRRRLEEDDEEPRRASKRRGSSRRRRSRDDEEPPKRGRRGAAAPRRRRKDRKEADLSTDIVEPERVPDAEIDLGAELEPRWEPGVMLGGGLGLVGVAFAVVSLMTSGGAVSTISVIGLVILLMSIAAGGIGVLARKSWGYILGIGAGGLGVVAGLLWSLYTVVGSDMSPIWPLFFFLCSLGSVIFLFHMRWGPGPMADERERLRSLKVRTANHTTVSGELALSGSIAAVLASVLCGLLLMGASTSSGSTSNAAARFVDGMELETYSEPPETGTIVLARWGNEDYFFLGRIDQARNDDELHIAYLDGDRAWVRLQDIRHDTIRAGASVHVHVQGHDGWLPAVVTQRSGNRVEADVGSQRVWVPLGMVRVREAP